MRQSCGKEPDHPVIAVFRTQYALNGPDQPEIPDQYGRRTAKDRTYCWFPAAGGASVHDVVVKKGRIVEQLACRSVTDRICGYSPGGSGRQKAQDGAEKLSGMVQKMPVDAFQKGYVAFERLPDKLGSLSKRCLEQTLYVRIRLQWKP